MVQMVGGGSNNDHNTAKLSQLAELCQEMYEDCYEVLLKWYRDAQGK